MTALALQDYVELTNELAVSLKADVVLDMAQLLVVGTSQLASLVERPSLPAPCVRRTHNNIIHDC